MLSDLDDYEDMTIFDKLPKQMLGIFPLHFSHLKTACEKFVLEDVIKPEVVALIKRDVMKCSDLQFPKLFGFVEIPAGEFESAKFERGEYKTFCISGILFVIWYF